VPIVVDDSAVTTDETIAVETEDLHWLVMLWALGGRGFLQGNVQGPALLQIFKGVDLVSSKHPQRFVLLHAVRT